MEQRWISGGKGDRPRSLWSAIAVTPREVTALFPTIRRASPSLRLYSSRSFQWRSSACFASVKDKHLLRLGVPEELLPVVRSMKTDADLERAESAFPQEAYEALFLLASGYTVDQVFAETQKTPEPLVEINRSDFN